mmetsp:Transcript_35866/g.77557  ORF Transcript_35866/g.77557 Transcript_35866/m.77557 type:complete len:239 (+) Transcript_35866:148-864(+)
MTSACPCSRRWPLLRHQTADLLVLLELTRRRLRQLIHHQLLEVSLHCCPSIPPRHWSQHLMPRVVAETLRQLRLWGSELLVQLRCSQLALRLRAEPTLGPRSEGPTRPKPVAVVGLLVLTRQQKQKHAMGPATEAAGAEVVFAAAVAVPTVEVAAAAAAAAAAAWPLPLPLPRPSASAGDEATFEFFALERGGLLHEAPRSGEGARELRQGVGELARTAGKSKVRWRPVPEEGLDDGP